MEDLRRLLVEDGRQQLELPLKPEIEEYFLFCMTDVVDGSPTIEWNKSMNPSTMSSRLKDLGEIHGWLHTFFAHRMRYGGGKALNESGKFLTSTVSKQDVLVPDGRPELTAVHDRGRKRSAAESDHEACQHPDFLKPLSAAKYRYRHAEYHEWS
jgi:hypothetical protein